MTKNLIPEVCKMLGVEVGEEFKIGSSDSIYKFTKEGLMFENASINSWLLFGTDRTLTMLLTGELEIVKLPWKPKDGEAFYTAALSCDDNKLYIDKRYWSDKYIDHLGLFKAGWVYRTKEEAEAALPKVAEELGVEYEI